MDKEEQVLKPGRHATAIFTFLTLLPFVYYIPPWLSHNVTENHFIVTVMALAIIVPLVSYAALPLLNKVYKMLT